MKKQALLKNKKIAIVADWLTNFAGSENVILELHKMFPDAPIFTTVYNEKLKEFKNAKIKTSFLQKIPFAKTKHQLFLKWMPNAIESFDLSDFDIVISSAHSIAKGIITKTDTIHFSYCHSPMRYAWDDSHRYIRESNFPGIVKKFFPFFMKDIRIWDRLSADRVDYFFANSNFIAKRIKKYYKRNSKVIFPPVDIKKFYTSKKKGDYFLAMGRLIPYKKFDLIIEAFNDLGLKLKIIGTGSDKKKLIKMAKKNIEFLGFIDKKERNNILSNARAFLFPQVEDFGISAVEAIASGTPLISFYKGGAKDIVTPENGIFFEEQNKKSLKKAIKEFIKNENKFNSEKIRNTSFRFDKTVFRENIINYISQVIQKETIS